MGDYLISTTSLELFPTGLLEMGEVHREPPTFRFPRPFPRNYDQVSWTADASLGWANLKRGACHSSHPTEPPLSLGTALHTEQSAFDQHQDPKWYNPAMCGRFHPQPHRLN